MPLRFTQFLGLATLSIAGVVASVAIASPAARTRVAVLDAEMPGQDADVTKAVCESLTKAGFAVDRLTAEKASDPRALDPGQFFLLVLPSMRCYPTTGIDALTRYLQSKGNLMVVGGSPFESPAWKHQGRWLDRAGVRQLLSTQKPPRIAFGFEQPDASRDWKRGGDAPHPASAVCDQPGADGTKGCLKLTFQHMTTSARDAFSAPISAGLPAGQPGLLCFWAKGDAQTSQIAIRLSEAKFDDRGIAVIALTPQWQYYVLSAADFRRIGQTDPARAKRVSFEFIGGLTTRVADGPHTIWIDQIGIAADPLPNRDDRPYPFPLIETLSPAYKLYPLTDATTLNQLPIAGASSELKLPAAGQALSCYPRPEGKGSQRGYQWRWIPLVEACAADGSRRGHPAWMLLHNAPLAEGPAFDDAAARCASRDLKRHQEQKRPAEGSVCAACMFGDREALKAIANGTLLGDMAKRIASGLFLSHAGADQFSYWPGETAQLAGTVVNHSAASARLELRFLVSDSKKQVLFENKLPLAVEAAGKATAGCEWPVSSAGTVRTELWHDGRLIDAIEHEVGLLAKEQPPAEAFVSVQNGQFRCEGRPWYPVGVNYWPRATIATEPADYTYHWLTPGYYDPEEVDRDLSQLAAMGGNFVAIRAHFRNDQRTVLDFLRRCRRHNIRVMLHVQRHEVTDEPHYFQGIMNPTNFQADAVREFIEATRLAHNPTLLAYDLIWEPAGWMFAGGNYMFGWANKGLYRDRWDADWAVWIDQRYGSLANAEADWGLSAPRREGKVTSPSDRQFKEDGPWRVMVAAYRRFMDDLMSRKWNDAVRAIDRLDSRHLISFRQGNIPPIDFTLTATGKHLDFFCMEGYDFKPDERGAGAVGFINRYVQHTTGGMPIVWGEFGMSVWDAATMRPDPAAVELQGRNQEQIYRIGWQTGAQGASPWWWAGGYRVSEQSDFGILEPDGRPRPSARLLAEYAKRFAEPPPAPRGEVEFVYDRDATPGAHWQAAFHDGGNAYREAAKQDRKLLVRTPGSGSTSATTPVVAVGNTVHNGRNPPKYLNAEFNGFTVQARGGALIEVRHGDRVRVRRGAMLMATASVGNTQEATWLAATDQPKRSGGVYLKSTEASGLAFEVPLAANTPWLDDAEFGPFPLTNGLDHETTVEVRVYSRDRAWFGETLRFVLVPE